MSLPESLKTILDRDGNRCCLCGYLFIWEKDHDYYPIAINFNKDTRLIHTCCSKGIKSDFVPNDPEIMACVNTGCDGTWLWFDTMKIPKPGHYQKPVFKMCAVCQDKQGLLYPKNANQNLIEI